MDKSFIGKRTRRLYAIINATTAIFLVVVGVFFISNFNATSSASDLPDYYDLRDSSAMVPLKNQGDLGLCWAYATLTSTESFLIENNLSRRWNPVLLSEFQLDYALSNNGMNSFRLPYNSDNRPLQGGGSQAFWWLKSGFSPALLSEFGEGYYNQEDTNKLPVESVIKKQQYAIVDYDHITDTATKTKERIIKEHIMKDGAVYVDTSMTANCIAQDLWTNNNNEIYREDYLIDYTPACNQYETFIARSEMHAMTVIGWDDYYRLDYCDDAPPSSAYYKNSGVYSINHCKRIRTVAGAWILQNSWGETIPYPYLSYESTADFYAPTQYMANFDDVDTTYSQTSIVSHRIIDGTYIATFQSSEATCGQNDGCESIIGLNFENQSDSEYDIFISPTGEDADFAFVKSVSEELEGAVWVDIPSFKIPSDLFSVKIVPKNTTRFIEYPHLNVFSHNTPSPDDSTTVNARLKNENIYSYTNSISLHISTHLYPQSEDVKDIDIQFLDNQGNDITDDFAVTNIYNIDNDLFVDYEINCQLNYDFITARVFYASTSHQVQTTGTKDFQFSITNLAKISEQGTGTISDPYVITTPEQLVAIGSRKEYMNAHYVLVGDIDFANYLDTHNFEPIGATINEAFSGSLDGQNHAIKNLKPTISDTSINTGLFDLLKNASIKNLSFYNCDFTGNYVGALAPKIDSSVISNISVYDSILTGKVVGSIVGFSSEDGASTYTNLFSNSTINCKRDKNNSICGGLMGESYSDELSKGVFQGTINAEAANMVGGVIGSSGFNTVSDIAIYNYGQWSIGPEVGIGIIAGDSGQDSWSAAVADDNNTQSSLYLFERGIDTNIRNSYIVNRIDEAHIFKNPRNVFSENIVVLSPDQTSISGNYSFLDFNNTWEMRDGLPAIQKLGSAFSSNNIGTSMKYNIDPFRHVISNVKVYSDTGYITKEQFINNFTTFDGVIYDKDGTTEITSPSAKLASGMFVKNNNEAYTIAIVGDCHSILPSLNAADIVCMRRKLGNIEVDSIPDNILKDVVDINMDGDFDITDVVILRRALTKGYPTEETYVYEQI